MPRPTDATVLLIEGDDERASKYHRWLNDYTVEAASGPEDALERIDDDIDVVLLDGSLAETDHGELLGRIRARHVDSQIGLLSGQNAGSNVLRLDFDEYVPRPVNREELRATVERLDDRKAVMEVVEKYLTLVAQKRSLEARRDSADLAADERYRELTGELAGRRQQITTLLSQLAGSDSEAEHSPGDRETPDAGPGRPNGGNSGEDGLFPPLYEGRQTEFYALWLAAALTYGVGDILSTVYAVMTVPGLIEGNPVVNTLLQNFGLSGFLLFKLLVFFVLISISVQGARSRERLSYYWPPAVMTALGVGLTGWNLRLILGG